METLVLERTTPMDALLSLMGTDRLFAVKRGQAALLTPVEVGANDIDPDDYPDTTAYLSAIPGMKEKLIAGMNAPSSECRRVPREYFNV